jgi:hypothetical protein
MPDLILWLVGVGIKPAFIRQRRAEAGKRRISISAGQNATVNRYRFDATVPLLLAVRAPRVCWHHNRGGRNGTTLTDIDNAATITGGFDVIGFIAVTAAIYVAGG